MLLLYDGLPVNGSTNGYRNVSVVPDTSVSPYFSRVSGYGAGTPVELTAAGGVPPVLLRAGAPRVKVACNHAALSCITMNWWHSQS
jgi:hypothetical protein